MRFRAVSLMASLVLPSAYERNRSNDTGWASWFGGVFAPLKGPANVTTTVLNETEIIKKEDDEPPHQVGGVAGRALHSLVAGMLLLDRRGNGTDQRKATGLAQKKTQARCETRAGSFT